MVDQRGERREILWAPAFWAMVKILLVYMYRAGISAYHFRIELGPAFLGGVLTDRRLEVLVQAGQCREGPGTEIALVAMAIPGPPGSLVRVGTLPTDHVLRYDAARVLLSYKAVQVVLVNTSGPGTRASLKMVGHACGRSEVSLAEGALYLGSEVDARLQMLYNGQHRDRVDGPTPGPRTIWMLL